MSDTLSAPPPALELVDATRVFTRRGGLFKKAGKAVRAVDGVSLTIRAGETLGLVGESGSGKSTLGRLALRLVEPTSGRLLVDGRDVTGVSKAEMQAMRRDIQMVFQDPYGSLDPCVTIGQSIAEPLKVHGLWDSDGPQKVDGVMSLVGLDPSHADRYPHQFSGGQRQRIGIARALTLDPKILVLDEPVSALDVSIQAQIINLLQRIQRERGLSYLFIAHDLAVVRHVSHRIAVMYLGKVVEMAERDNLYRRPLHPYTVSLLAAVPIADVRMRNRRRTSVTMGEIGSATNVPPGCRFHPRCYRARLVAAAGGVPTERSGDALLPRACLIDQPALRACGGADQVACHFPETPETRSEVATAVLQDIGYPPIRPIPLQSA
ncbi:peptide ABC transporter ATPase (plasmid) [Azospirillum argentinense]|uniref:Peptide ABC transporter ATPase n=1 Tax=Azospirillum argentinense TaxID=2970906 RepID=A0A060DWK1_9PROT|nr:oligopeptide/dipeptide ABC transporter ATP-binding protein [Azospirillum argentinense]AIB15473.1 peptide ABC transporter ATPase [Azospirillum argentinense]EZQ04257.1 peptide ABC transporter ATPase [Azospirillum argentinense]